MIAAAAGGSDAKIRPAARWPRRCRQIQPRAGRRLATRLRFHRWRRLFRTGAMAGGLSARPRCVPTKPISTRHAGGWSRRSNGFCRPPAAGAVCLWSASFERGDFAIRQGARDNAAQAPQVARNAVRGAKDQARTMCVCHAISIGCRPRLDAFSAAGIVKIRARYAYRAAVFSLARRKIPSIKPLWQGVRGSRWRRMRRPALS